ncbi:Uncharacterized protein Rs2_12214 [Raphanus sativus]|nr:Uncharacterized protein Rs2_12214 [Raphanus sativus]
MAGAKKLSSSAKTKPSSVSGKDKVSNGEDLVGSKVRVWWPIDRKFYNGVVDSFNSRTKKHRVFYDDGEKEILDMDKERWELIGDDDDDNAADEDKSDDEIADVIPEPPNRKSARTNGVMGDIGGKIVAAASRLRSCNKISEATNGKKKRASSSSSEAVSEKLKGKKKKKQEKEAPKEETKEGEPKEETKEGEEPKEEGEEGEEPKEEGEEGEEPKEEEEEGEQA